MFAEEGREFDGEFLFIDERKFFRVRLEKKIKGIIDGHFRHQIHRDGEAPGLFWYDQAGEIVGMRILLPVEKVIGRFDLERIAQNGRAAMRRRAQPDDLRPEGDKAVIGVGSLMVEGGVNGHAGKESLKSRSRADYAPDS